MNMFFPSVALFFLFSSYASGLNQCATRVVPLDEKLAIEARIQPLLASFERNGGRNSSYSIRVPTFFHVLTAGDALEQGNVPQSAVDAQFNVLSTTYEPFGFSFDLVSTNYIRNANWSAGFHPGNNAELEAMLALRKGGPETLNVYVTTLGKKILGYSYLPSEYSSQPERDGVVLLYSVLPGGTQPGFGLGYVLVHEVGHWLGLYHTFEGGCKDEDMVSDTPAQASASKGCPVGRDSCPDQPGLEPIHNYMDYSDDACLSEFSPGQVERMHAEWQAYREQTPSS
jgi:hypothetical protein